MSFEDLYAAKEEDVETWRKLNKKDHLDPEEEKQFKKLDEIISNKLFYIIYKNGIKNYRFINKWNFFKEYGQQTYHELKYHELKSIRKSNEKIDTKKIRAILFLAVLFKLDLTQMSRKKIEMITGISERTQREYQKCYKDLFFRVFIIADITNKVNAGKVDPVEIKGYIKRLDKEASKKKKKPVYRHYMQLSNAYQRKDQVAVSSVKWTGKENRALGEREWGSTLSNILVPNESQIKMIGEKDESKKKVRRSGIFIIGSVKANCYEVTDWFDFNYYKDERLKIDEYTKEAA
jgi:hypothetical protein